MPLTGSSAEFTGHSLAKADGESIGTLGIHFQFPFPSLNSKTLNFNSDSEVWDFKSQKFLDIDSGWETGLWALGQKFANLEFHLIMFWVSQNSRAHKHLEQPADSTSQLIGY